MSVKISELPILDSLADNDVIAGVDTSANVTSKIEMVTLKNYIDTNTQYTAGTNIDITNNVVSAPNVYNKTETDELLEEKDEQIEELQSEVDSLSTIFNAFPTESDEDESMTLDGTAEVKFKKFDLKGNASQTGTPTPTTPIPVNVVSGDNEIEVCGKNLLENTIQSQTTSGITFTRNENGSLTFSGTATQACSMIGQFTKDLILKAGTTYIFSLGNKQAGYGVYLQKTGNNNVYYLGVSTTNSSLTITPTEDTVIQQLTIHFPNGNTVNGTIYPMLEVGSSATTYEPYQGNTYNIDLPVENLWGGFSNSFSKTDYGVQFTANQDGSITANGTATNTATSILLSEATSNGIYKTLASGTYTVSGGGTKYTVEIYNKDNANKLASITPSGSSVSFTLNDNANIVLRVQVASGVTINETIKLQIEKGTKANSYTPYGTTPIELCKIGNYQDYFYKDNGSWYLHKEIGKIVLNGSESGWHTSSLSVEGYKSYYVDSSVRINQDALGSKCNYFEYKTYNEWQNLLKATFIENTYQAIGIRVVETLAPTLADFKTWLSTHNTIAYYGLSTPTNTEITYQPLIDQLNLLEKAMSKDSQTNISQVSNDKPFILDVTAIKSLQNVLDRIELLES